MNIITKSSYLSQSFIFGPRIYQLQIGRRNIYQIDTTSLRYTTNQKPLLKCPFERTSSMFCIFRNTDVLYSMSLSRSVSYFSVHPEKLKQMVKLKSAQNLVSVLASENYKRRLLDFMEQQKSYLTDSKRIGIPECEIKYQHMIDCAQPTQENMTEEREEDTESKKVQIIVPPTIRRSKKTTVVAAFMKRKMQEQEKIARLSEDRTLVKQSTILPILMETRKKNLERRKKFRRRTTILPIILKKLADQKTLVRKSKPKQEPILMLRNIGNDENQQKEALAAIESSKISGRKVGVGKRKIHAIDTWTDFDRQFREKQEAKMRSNKEDTKQPIESEEIHDHKSNDTEIQRICGDTEIVRRSFIRSRPRPVEDVFSLFDKVKTGTMNRIVVPLEDKKAYSIRANDVSREPTVHEPSLTYKIVCKEKARHQQAQRAKFKFDTKRVVLMKEVMKKNPKQKFIINVDDIVFM